MRALKMAHATDPRTDILDRIGDIKNLEVFHNHLLVAIYKRPEKTAGGIILTDQTRQEDVWQGKVGLVLKVGPSAFVDDATTTFRGVSVKEGDWVYFRASDGTQLTLGSVECRYFFDEKSIMGRIPSPDYVF